ADGSRDVFMQRVAVPHVEEPAAIRLSPADDRCDRLLNPRIRLNAGRAQIVEPAQHVIVPKRRERELRPRRIDDLTGRAAPEEPALEQILLCARPGICDRGSGTERLLEGEQAFEYADCRVEG